MMKKYAKLLPVLLCFVLLISLIPIYPVAAASPEDLPFTLSGANGEALNITVGMQELYDEEGTLPEEDWIYTTPVTIELPEGYSGNTYALTLSEGFEPAEIGVRMTLDGSIGEDGCEFQLTLLAQEDRETGISFETHTIEVAPYTHVEGQSEFSVPIGEFYYDGIEELLEEFEGEAFIAEYLLIKMPGLPLTLYEIRVQNAPAQTTTEYVLDASISVGQWENPYTLNTDKEAYFVVPYGCDQAEVSFQVPEYVMAAMVNGGDFIMPDDEMKLNTVLYASPTGAENEIILYTEIEEEVYLTVIGISQNYTQMPTSVEGYLCIGSQYTNRTGEGDYGLRAVRSLVGSNYSAGGGRSGPVSLGSFGGYITYYFEDAITDNPNNPYGIDFITFGNCVEPSNEFAEPGQVYVSEDGETWYALAGGMHYEDYAVWDYTIWYENGGPGTTYWTDNLGEDGEFSFKYPDPKLYNHHSFEADDEYFMSFSGILFRPADAIRPHYSGFGYTDMGQLGTILPGEKSSDYSSEEWTAMLARNIAGNPYLGTYVKNGREFSDVTDGMDLAWAVDEDGQPVDVSGKEFHYVKIVSASNIDAGGIGEKSTEVNMVRIAQANDADVGITAAPSKITVDGVDLELSAAQSVSDNQFIVENAVVDGPFKVEVEAPEDAHIYINNNSASYANFDGMPLHKIVRVIVQEGEKEPVIYVINLTETTETPAPAAELTLDANGGTINGGATYSIKFDANMAGDPLPTPSAAYPYLEFAGWYAGLQPVDSIPSVVEDATFVAHWAVKTTEPEDNVSVSFRLIGATKATADIDLTSGGYNGAEYVTWIKTTNYTLTAGSTVADLIVKACGEAGLAQSNALGGYVATVTAPAAYGGYELSEFTNGKRSGWMYTIGGAHPGRGVAEQVLNDGDVVILHYVNDYAMEVEDWAALGGEGWPSLYGDNTDYLNAWMAAEDVAPPEAETPSEPTKPSEPAEPFKMPFVDVPEDAFYYDAVAWAVQNGITNGTTETTFSPDDDCYREQIVTFLWRAAGEPEPTIESVPFVDLDESAYYYKAVLWAYEQGVTLGVDETHFGVGQVCTREQVVTFMYRAANKPAVSGDAPFTDVEAGAWYADAVKWAADAEITLGVGGGLFGTGLTCTRGQIVTFLYRASEQ